MKAWYKTSEKMPLKSGEIIEGSRLVFETTDKVLSKRVENIFKSLMDERKMERSEEMEDRAQAIVHNYIVDHLDRTDGIPKIEIYTVWKCKALQNWKFLISSSLPDGMYYELTYNGDKDEWYLDAYKKFENRVISELRTDCGWGEPR